MSLRRVFLLSLALGSAVGAGCDGESGSSRGSTGGGAVAPVANQAEEVQAEQRASADRLFELQLPGIWRADFVIVNGRYEPADLVEATYLILRDNGTFRIVKKGRKSRGSWQLDERGKLLMDVEGDATKVATFAFQPPDKLELQFEEDGNPLKMEFVRTDLEEEPMGIDEG